MTSSWVAAGAGAEDKRVWEGGVEGGESGKISARGWERGGEFCIGGDGQAMNSGFCILSEKFPGWGSGAFGGDEKDSNIEFEIRTESIPPRFLTASNFYLIYLSDESLAEPQAPRFLVYLRF